ncbi:glycerol-3-phosphate 1-O-acyltransferase PlsY [bacterium]|nr:glycerol-3-phosphate 1-O-acyltransferase PlsY [bacterium]
MILIAMKIIISAMIAYIIGSIPTGYIIVKSFTGQDIRQIGSGSTGATNVKRVMGKKWFFIVMILDALKGAIPVLVAKYIPYLQTSSEKLMGLTAVIAAIFVLIGHSKSIFLGFTGGKSVASGVGTILALSPYVGICIAVIWGIITYISKYVSLGSIIALALSPILMFLFGEPISYIIYSIIGAIYVIYLHRENIKRLISGNENKVR